MAIFPDVGTGPLTSPIYAQTLAAIQNELALQQQRADAERAALSKEAAARAAAVEQGYTDLTRAIRNEPPPTDLPLPAAPSGAMRLLGTLVGGKTATGIAQTDADTRATILANAKARQDAAQNKLSEIRALAIDRLTRLAHHAETLGNLDDANKYTLQAEKLAKLEGEQASTLTAAAAAGSEGLRTQAMANATVEAANARHAGVSTLLPGMTYKDYSAQLDNTLAKYKDKRGNIPDEAFPALRMDIAVMRHQGMTTPQQWVDFLKTLKVRKGGFFSNRDGVPLFDLSGKTPESQSQQRMLNSLADILFPDASQTPVDNTDTSGDGTTDEGGYDTPALDQEETPAQTAARRAAIAASPEEQAAAGAYQQYAGKLAQQLSKAQQALAKSKEQPAPTGGLAPAQIKQRDHEQQLLRIQIRHLNDQLKTLHTEMMQRFGIGVVPSLPETTVK